MNFYLKFSRVLYACRANARTLGSVSTWPQQEIEDLRELLRYMAETDIHTWLDSAIGSELAQIQAWVGSEVSATFGLDGIIEQVKVRYASLGILPIEYPAHMQ